jgi:uncharacterized RDD family membrane protein YckC
MSKIIITTTDTRVTAESLQTVLQSYFGKNNVVIGFESFITSQDNPAGDVHHAVSNCKAVLVLIGENWLQNGWAEDVTNPLRVAITSALSLNKPLLIVSVSDAPLPPADKLPESLKPIAGRIPVPLRATHQRSDSIAIANLLEGFFDKDEVSQSVYSVNLASRGKLELASGWDRFGAYMIDAILLYLVNLALEQVAREQVRNAFTMAEVDQIILTYLIIRLIFYLSYQFVSNYFGGQTIGKMIFGIRVVRTNGEKLRLVDAAMRAFGYFISGLFLGLGFVWAFVDERKQGWHDKIAKTLVVKNR